MIFMKWLLSVLSRALFCWMLGVFKRLNIWSVVWCRVDWRRTDHGLMPAFGFFDQSTALIHRFDLLKTLMPYPSGLSIANWGYQKLDLPRTGYSGANFIQIQCHGSWGWKRHGSLRAVGNNWWTGSQVYKDGFTPAGAPLPDSYNMLTFVLQLFATYVFSRILWRALQKRINPTVLDNLPGPDPSSFLTGL